MADSGTPDAKHAARTWSWVRSRSLFESGLVDGEIFAMWVSWLALPDEVELSTSPAPEGEGGQKHPPSWIKLLAITDDSNPPEISREPQSFLELVRALLPTVVVMPTTSSTPFRWGSRGRTPARHSRSLPKGKGTNLPRRSAPPISPIRRCENIFTTPHWSIASQLPAWLNAPRLTSCPQASGGESESSSRCEGEESSPQDG